MLTALNNLCCFFSCNALTNKQTDCNWSLNSTFNSALFFRAVLGCVFRQFGRYLPIYRKCRAMLESCLFTGSEKIREVFCEFIHGLNGCYLRPRLYCRSSCLILISCFFFGCPFTRSFVYLTHVHFVFLHFLYHLKHYKCLRDGGTTH